MNHSTMDTWAVCPHWCEWHKPMWAGVTNVPLSIVTPAELAHWTESSVRQVVVGCHPVSPVGRAINNTQSGCYSAVLCSELNQGDYKLGAVYIADPLLTQGKIPIQNDCLYFPFARMAQQKMMTCCEAALHCIAFPLTPWKQISRASDFTRLFGFVSVCVVPLVQWKVPTQKGLSRRRTEMNWKTISAYKSGTGNTSSSSPGSDILPAECQDQMLSMGSLIYFIHFSQYIIYVLTLILKCIH